ncbi:MAG: hypothetical protein ACJASI_001554, partial [Glaciecola sp.]
AALTISTDHIFPEHPRLDPIVPLCESIYQHSLSFKLEYARTRVFFQAQI